MYFPNTLNACDLNHYLKYYNSLQNIFQGKKFYVTNAINY